MHFGISVAVPLVRPPNAIPQNPFGQPPPMLPHPRPYTLPFGQVASAKTQLVTTLGGAALFGFFGAVILHGVGRTGSGVGAAAGAALGAFLGKTLADKFA